MMRQKKAAAAGLAKDDEDVRVQSTNDEATGARACVFFCFVFLDFYPSSSSSSSSSLSIIE